MNSEGSKTMRKILLLILVTLLASTSFAADSKSVSYKSGDETVQAVLYTPAGKGHFPQSSSFTNIGA